MIFGDDIMKLGFITTDRAEQSSHRQKNRILREYPELLLVEIQPYRNGLVTNHIAETIVKYCRENNADTAVMDSAYRISPEPEELIKACSIISSNEITLEFIDQPWLNFSVWYGDDVPDSAERIHKKIVRITYDWILATDKHYSEARKKAAKTTEERGHRYGPKKGSSFKLTPEKEEKMKQILAASPTFVETEKTEMEVRQELGIPHATYCRYKDKLKEMYPEKVRKK